MVPFRKVIADLTARNSPGPLSRAPESSREATEGVDDHDPHVVVVLADIGDVEIAGSVEGQGGDGGEQLPRGAPVAHTEHFLELGGERDVLRGKLDDGGLGGQGRCPGPNERTDNAQGDVAGSVDARGGAGGPRACHTRSTISRTKCGPRDVAASGLGGQRGVPVVGQLERRSWEQRSALCQESTHTLSHARAAGRFHSGATREGSRFPTISHGGSADGPPPTPGACRGRPCRAG